MVREEGMTRFARDFVPNLRFAHLRSQARFVEPFGVLVPPLGSFAGDFALFESGTASGEKWCARRDSNPRPTGCKPVALTN